jgi:hypothetical protein
MMETLNFQVLFSWCSHTTALLHYNAAASPCSSKLMTFAFTLHFLFFVPSPTPWTWLSNLKESLFDSAVWTIFVVPLGRLALSNFHIAGA